MASRASTFGEVNPERLPRLVRVELFKLRRRPMARVLMVIAAGVCLVFPLLTYVMLRYVVDAGTGDVAGQDRSVVLDRTLFPDVLKAAPINVVAFAVPMLMVFVASSFGGEFAWGTVRQLLARGQSRADYVLAKLGAAVLWWTLTVALALAAGLLPAVMLGVLGAEPGPGAATAGEWSRFAGLVALVWFATLPYLTLTALATIQLRSTAWGMAVSFMGFFGERLAFDGASRLEIGPLEWIVRAGINYNVRAVVSPDQAPKNPPELAVAILTAYLIVCAVGAFRTLQRQDVVISGVG